MYIMLFVDTFILKKKKIYISNKAKITRKQIQQLAYTHQLLHRL